MKDCSALEKYMVKKGHSLADVKKNGKKSKADEDKAAGDQSKDELPSKLKGSVAKAMKGNKKVSKPEYL